MAKKLLSSFEFGFLSVVSIWLIVISLWFAVSHFVSFITNLNFMFDYYSFNMGILLRSLFSLIYSCLFVVLLVGSVGLFKSRSWGRKLSLGVLIVIMIFDMLIFLISTINDVILSLPRFWIIIGFNFDYLVLRLALFSILLYFLSRDSVKKLF